LENINFKCSGTELHIEGFPDGLKVVKLHDKLAKRASDLALHKDDLEFAEQCLNRISDTPGIDSFLQETLWRCAIIHFTKCFGNSAARSQLSAKPIFSRDKTAVLCFEYFKTLRNKHFIHDENSYMQSHVGAIINGGNKSYKVEKIVCSSIAAQTFNETNLRNLKLLIIETHKHVIGQLDEIFVLLTKQLEAKTYSELISMPNLQFKAPSIDGIQLTRTQ